jgi:calcineurin-like phosphoesterase
VRLLAIGDVVGRPGRRAVAALLPDLRRELALDFVIANGENAAAGRGLTEKTAKDLFAAGVDVLTSGNHIWDQK